MPPTTPKTKRRARLSAITRATILAALEQGQPYHVAASAAGVSPRTLREWIARGEGRSPRPSTPALERLARDVAIARAKGEVALFDAVRAGTLRSGAHDWRASAWLLERTRPETYSIGGQVRVRLDRELEVMFDRLERGLDPATFERVMVVLAGETEGERALAPAVH